MDTVNVELEIYSPRWGRKDIYKIELAKNSMTIKQGGNIITCEWQENFDPKWSGSRSLEDILENDSIYPPSIFQDLIEHAWKSWRNGELNYGSVNDELQALAEWLNKITESKPSTDFWSKYF